MTFKDKLVNAITQYDIKCSKRKGYNRYALAQYFMAIDDAMVLVQKGKSIESALNSVFNDRLLAVCLKAIQETK